MRPMCISWANLLFLGDCITLTPMKVHEAHVVRDM